MDFKGWKNEMLRKFRTTLILLFIAYACLYVHPLDAIILTPEKIIIYQSVITDSDSKPKAVIDSQKKNFPIPYLFSSPQTEHMEINPANKIKSRCVLVRIPQLKYAAKINLNLFPDLHQVARFKRLESRFADDFTWFGSVDASDDIDVILTVKGNAVYGNITIDEQLYQISPITPPLHEISLMDYSGFPQEHSPVVIQQAAHEDTPPEYTTYPQGDDGSVIHLMVLYTQKAAKESGHIHALIQLAIDETNLSYEQSNIQTRLNLVHVHQVDYMEQDILSDLNHLAHKNDSFMDEIHDLRDQYSADIVVMIESSDQYCGVSYLNPDADFGFCVVSVKCATGYYSFGHEIGHLFGARHNPEVDPKNDPYPYGHGYLNINGWRTVMAYNDSYLCPNGYCKRVMHWSNPGVRFQNSYTGSFSKHNNSRVLNEAAVKLANFKYFGNRFTIYNNNNHPISIQSIEPSNKWIKIVSDTNCPFQIKGMESKTFKLTVNWQQINTTTSGHIDINHDNRIDITAIPSISLTNLSVMPNEITCNKNITITDIQITDCQNVRWQAISKTSWITIIDGYRGLGNGTVRLRVDHNAMGMREGYVEIAAMNSPVQQKVKIVQAGNCLSVLMPLKVRENDGLLSKAGQIVIPSPTTKQLKVKLCVSDNTALILPEFVIIPEREKSVRFDLQIQNNSQSDGPRIVKIDAVASGWFSGGVAVNILDDESDGIIYVGENQAYETIHSAVEDASSDSSILVLSGTYNENIRLSRPVHLFAVNGPAHTIIKGKDSTHTIEIAHSNVIVEGFTIIGADNHGQAGIYLSPEANNCVVKNNICGQDDQRFNYYGIFVNGGGFHTLTHNLCQHNKRFGIYLDQSNLNTIAHNTCQLNQRTGMNLIQSQYNVIYKNILKYHPKYGLNLSYNSNHNTLYLNAFISNDNGNVYSQWSANTWQTPVPVNHSFGHGFLGNYVDDHRLDDLNDDGITDTIYQLHDNEILEYPLSKEPEYYESQTLIINQHNQLISDEMPEMQTKCLCAAGKTVLFQTSPYRHGKLEWSGKDAQTGNICFVSPIQHHHNLLLQPGKVDSDGTFIKAGQEHIIVGDGDRVNFRFCIFPGDFFIDTNEQFAFQITNKSPVDYSIWIGGGHTHISPYEHEHAAPLEWTVGKDATFRSIQSALSLLTDFQSGKALTLAVLPGSYTDNIKIDSPVSLISTQGYTQTYIAAKRSDKHVIHIQSDHVKISGFSIFGANRNNASGLCIDRGVANCLITNNRLGFDPAHTNDYGIIIHASIKNTLIHNQCIANEKHGIWMDTAFMNTLSHNACYQNQNTGIYMTASLLNHLTHNSCENNRYDGIHLMKSSRNQLYFNILAANDNNGLSMDADSFINLIYLNNFVLNQGHNVFSQGMNQWSSDTQKTYQFSNNMLTSYMGNYYGDHVGQDYDHNGLSDTPYDNNGNDQSDVYALVRPCSFYEFIDTEQSVYLADNQGSDITKNTIAATMPHIETIEKAQSVTTPLTENEQQKPIEFTQRENFVKVEKESDPIKHDTSMQPILILTDVPTYGNRLKNLKGLVLNVEPESHHIAVYIYIEGKGWRSKPYPAAPMTTINPDGRWECDITTAAFDQNADTIVAVLYISKLMPPTLMDAPVLPDTIFEKGAGVVRTERKK